MKHFRTELSKLDNQCEQVTDFLEGEDIEKFNDVELAEDLKEKIEDLKNLITELQESQNWI